MTKIKLVPTLGEGPQLFVVVVDGALHSCPTMWPVRAWDHGAAEKFAIAEAGYETPECGIDDRLNFVDSTLVGEIKEGA